MRNVFAGIIFIAAIFVGLWILYLFIQEVYLLYKSATPELKLSVLTASGSVLAFIINNAVQSSRERKARLFEQKRQAYEQFFEFFFSMFNAQKNNERLDSDQNVKKLNNFKRGLMTWGSSDAINAVNNWQGSMEKIDNADLKLTFQKTENLIRSLRKDLGHNDNMMGKFQLTKLILRADEHDKLD